MKRFIAISCCVIMLAANNNAIGQDLQPFAFKTSVLLETMTYLGSPLNRADGLAIQSAILKNDKANSVNEIEEILDKYCLFNITVNPESRTSVAPGLADARLWQNGWRTFLVKITNQAGITSPLNISSDEAKPVYDGGERMYGMGAAGRGTNVTRADIADRWLDLSVYNKHPMQATLSGLETEYFILQLYSRDAGKRAAKFRFNVGGATQDIGFRGETNVLFDCMASTKIIFKIRDGQQPVTASFTIKDAQGNVYPSQSKRLAPDFFFQSQIYRKDGDTIDLHEGNYNITYNRGPEYVTETRNITVTKEPMTVEFKLNRWINPAKFNYYSGDHHIHAAGCSHYESPTEGVDPADMMQHILGEGVNVGSVLTWGPGYYHQKQFFEGKDNALSTPQNLMRYDLEISGFPSSHAGHLVLLRLKDQDYPHTKVIEDWPTWTIPVLKWAKAQGAITGYAHSGLGLEVHTDSLPNYQMPKFDGIGANEYIVAVTQNLVDFISTMDTPPTWELNIWYHTLNCGYRTRISGETDFPCMSDDKVAHGRSYVKLTGKLNFDDWVSGLKKGTNYVSDGKSHLFNFTVNGTEVGTGSGEVKLNAAATVKVSVDVAAYLNKEVDSTKPKFRLDRNVWDQKPFWDVERARIGTSREVPLELIVNGEVVAIKNVAADGSIQHVEFEVPVAKSSWIACRILPSSHSNPVFVTVNNLPIRANKKSAEWCLHAVDQCWSQKAPLFSPKEKIEAAKIYERARDAYRKVIEEAR